jgi:hypothetical protein
VFACKIGMLASEAKLAAIIQPHVLRMFIS